MTLGSRLDTFKGIGPGFDHLRVGLSLSILVWHSFGAVYGAQWAATLPGFVLALLGLLLPMFFGLSGFLIMGSALRTHDVKTFITFRVLRILPALVVEITLSAVLLGAAVTTLPLSQYYSDPMFFRYFKSLIGAIQYHLPGVFTDHPITVVNGALWTVGPEIVCYCIVAALMLTGLFIRKGPMIFCTAAFFGLCIITDQWNLDRYAVHMPIKALILCFLSGNLLFLYKDRIPYRFELFFGCALISIIAIVAAHGFVSLNTLYYVAAMLLPYCAAFIGLTSLPPMPFFHRGDYSYGIYIYSFPIQQTIVHFWPGLRTWWFNILLALPLTIAFAVLSWHLVEKPFLSLRKRIQARPGSIGPQSVPRRSLPRKAVILALIVAYGLFVTNAAQIFPLKQIYHMLFGTGTIERPVDVQQF